MSKIREIIAKPFEKLMDMIQGIIVTACALSCIVLSLLMFVTVIARYYFDYNIVWSQLVMTSMLSWGTFLILGSVTRKNQHISIGFFAKILFKGKAKSVQFTIENIVGLIFCTYVAWYSYQWVDNTRDLGLFQFVGNDTYKEWIVQMVMPIAFTALSMFYLERCIRQLHQLYLRLSRNHDGTSSDIGTV